MQEYITSALFVHTAETADLLERIRNHACGATITPVRIEQLTAGDHHLLEGVDHAVVSGSLKTIKTVMKLSMNIGFSIGVVPTDTQKNLARYYDLPRNVEAAIDLALKADPTVIDLVLCNDQVVLFKVTMGRMPLLDVAADVSKFSILRTAIRQMFNIKLSKYRFATAGGRQITTAASGCMILHHRKGSMAARLISGDSSLSDGSLSTVVSAPISIIDYINFLFRLLSPNVGRKQLPNAIGYLKSPVIEIEPENELDVFIDGDKQSRTPLHCETKPAALRVNVGQAVRMATASNEPAKDRIEVDHLPRGKELIKAWEKKTIPFFSYASEERFRDLFTALHEDAKINTLYLVLMMLSTMLAAAGLYLDSASVIIGAMLLAPLMAPIVALAMGLLRGEEGMIKNSLLKTIAGIAIALLASTVITRLFPDKPVTGEMQARLNPTLLDLAVAIISGIAAAYSKSYKEIIQSLAGVAIAVALVPPLTVAGTGIGRGDFHFFFQAFLLFSTNLIGIIIAAALTFRVLGFSPAIRSKRGLAIVFCLLALITVPLYISYGRIVEDRIIEKGWQKERFLVNGKYVIVEKAVLRRQGDKKIVVMDVLVRDVLTREDMNEFKKKIETHFPGKLTIRAKTIYIP